MMLIIIYVDVCEMTIIFFVVLFTPFVFLSFFIAWFRCPNAIPFLLNLLYSVSNTTVILILIGHWFDFEYSI